MVKTATLAAGMAFGLNIILIPIILRLSHHFRWYDPPDKRKIHKGLIPRLGGTGMFLSFAAAILLSPLLLSAFTGGGAAFPASPRILYPLAGMFLIHLLGLIDDFYNLKAALKFFLQLLAASIVTAGGYTIRSFSMPYLGTFPLGVLAYPLTVLWIVGISNAINLIDGMDGLAGGICAFASLSIGIISLIQGEAVPAMLAFGLCGAILAFLCFNLPPAKIFMGDSGSLFLGFTLAVLPLMGISKASAFGTLIVPITLLAIPIIDTAAAIQRRIKNKRSIISPDKEHIHHKLLDIGLSERQILGMIYGCCLYLSIVSISSVILPKEVNVYLVMVVWAGSMLGYGFLNYLDGKRVSVKKRSAKGKKVSR